MKAKETPPQPMPRSERTSHGRIVAVPRESRYLDSVQLNRLEQAFRQWAKDAVRGDVRLSRQRILLIFLLIRYTGARLSEVLALNPARDFDLARQAVIFGAAEASPREVQIPEPCWAEIAAGVHAADFQNSRGGLFAVDPGHVRRKFYERAAACGFAKELGGPEAIRKSRAVELLQGNMPLPVVQKILGHSTPNLTAAFVSYSDDDVRQVADFFHAKESGRKTSARNTFFGKVSGVVKGDIQAKVELLTIGGERITALITNDSLLRLGLRPGMLIAAEVKAPWVVLQAGVEEPDCSAENRFPGTIARISRGRVVTEYTVRIADGTELCALVAGGNNLPPALQLHAPVWAMFNSFSVVLQLD